jgi:hypothetical protein
MQDLLIDRVHSLIVAAAVLHHPRVLPRSLKRTAPPPQKSEPHQSNQSPKQANQIAKSTEKFLQGSRSLLAKRRGRPGSCGSSRPRRGGPRGGHPRPHTATGRRVGGCPHRRRPRRRSPWERASWSSPAPARKLPEARSERTRRNFRPVFESGRWCGDGLGRWNLTGVGILVGTFNTGV